MSEHYHCAYNRVTVSADFRIASALVLACACSKEQPATLSQSGPPAPSAIVTALTPEAAPGDLPVPEAAAPSVAAPAPPAPASSQPPRPSQPQSPVPAPSQPPSPTPSQPPAPTPPPALTPAAARTSSAHWNVDFSTPGCASGTDCTATLRVEALADFHVNPDYHFRFVPNAVPGVSFSGGAPGDFALQGPKVGVMGVHYTASAPGAVTLSGTFKICVCTDAVCAPEPVSVSLAVTVR